MDFRTFMRLVNNVVSLEISQLHGLEFVDADEHPEQGTFSAYLQLRNNVQLPWHLFADSRLLYIVDESNPEHKERVPLNITNDDRPKLTESAVSTIETYIKSSSTTLCGVISSVINTEYMDEGGPDKKMDTKSVGYRDMYPPVADFVNADLEVFVSLNGASPMPMSTISADERLNRPISSIRDVIADIGYASSEEFLKIFQIRVSDGVMRLIRYVTPDADGKQKLSSTPATFNLTKFDSEVDPFTGKISSAVESDAIDEWLEEVVGKFAIDDNDRNEPRLNRGVLRVGFLDDFKKEQKEKNIQKWDYSLFIVDNIPMTYVSDTFKLGVTMNTTPKGTEITYFNKNNQRRICRLIFENDVRTEGMVFANKSDMAILEYVKRSSMKMSSENTGRVELPLDVARARVNDLITITAAASDICALAEYTASGSYKSAMIVTDKTHLSVITDYVVDPKKSVTAKVTVNSVKTKRSNSYILTIQQDSSREKYLVCSTKGHDNWYFSANDFMTADGDSMPNIYNEGKKYLEGDEGSDENTLGAFVVKSTDLVKQYIQVNSKGRFISGVDDNQQEKVDKQIRLQTDSPVARALLNVRKAFVNTFGEQFLSQYNLMPGEINGLSRTDKEGKFKQLHAEFRPGNDDDFGTFSSVAKTTSNGISPVVICYFPGDVYHAVSTSQNTLSDGFVKWYLFNDRYMRDNHLTNAIERDINSDHPLVSNQILELFAELSDTKSDEYDEPDENDSYDELNF